MKTFLKTIGLIVIASLIGLSITACGDGSGGGSGGGGGDGGGDDGGGGNGGGGTPIVLTENQWKDGNLPTANSVDWYSISITDNTTYRLWLNERGTSIGNGTKSGKVKVSVMTNEGAIIKDNLYELWASPSSFTPTYTGTVYIEVVPYDNFSIGTYGIVYSTGTTRPLISFVVDDAIPLTESEWKDGNLPAANSVDWYSISVTDNTTYRLWLNEDGPFIGDGTKTGEVKVSVMTNEGAIIKDNLYELWASPSSFTATYDGTVYVKVIPKGSSYTGTYGIVYSSTGTTRPPIPIPIDVIEDATPLVVNQWKNGDLPTASSMDWYSISVDSNVIYLLWVNERGGSSYGNDTKTGKVKVSVMTSEGEITGVNAYINCSWTTPGSFTVPYTGIVYVRVMPDYAGTYGIVYSNFNTRPTVSY